MMFKHRKREKYIHIRSFVMDLKCKLNLFCDSNAPHLQRNQCYKLLAYCYSHNNANEMKYNIFGWRKCRFIVNVLPQINFVNKTEPLLVACHVCPFVCSFISARTHTQTHKPRPTQRPYQTVLCNRNSNREVKKEQGRCSICMICTLLMILVTIRISTNNQLNSLFRLFVSAFFHLIVLLFSHIFLMFLFFAQFFFLYFCFPFVDVSNLLHAGGPPPTF